MRLRPVVLAAAVSAAIPAATLSVIRAGDRAEAPVALSQVQLADARSTDTGAPTVLPAIAHLRSETGEPKAPGAVFRQYSLDGAANASNITTEGMLLRPKEMHPSTELSISFVPGFSHPDVPFDPSWFTRTIVDVNGAAASVIVAKNGLGTVRVDWVDAAGNYHVVLTERLRTSEGVSGLDVNTVLAIARSIGG